LPHAGSLPRAARAWEYGGAAGLETLESAWTPSRAELARARAAIADAWEGEEPPAFEVRRNWWTGEGVQLRYGRDGRWYPYRDSGGEWWPAGPAAQDPAAALAALLD
jgi:hypothetical protein